MTKRKCCDGAVVLATATLALAIGCGGDDVLGGPAAGAVGGAGGAAAHGGAGTAAGGGEAGGPSTSLEDGFLDPPRSARPTAYWWWLDGCVTEGAITGDLEAMAEQGMGGAILTDAGTQWYPQGSVDRPAELVDKVLYGSPRWHELFVWAVREADRLGLELAVNIGSGWNAGGPWISADHAQKRFVSRKLHVEGPQLYDAELPLPQPVLNGTVVLIADSLICTVQDYTDLAVHGTREDHTFPDQPSFGGDLVDLTPLVQPGGHLAYDVPAGSWTITRIGMVTYSCPTYPRNPGADDGRVCDSLSESAVDAHFAGGVQPLLDDLDDAGLAGLVGTTFRYVHDDSWDRGTPTWTPGFASEFEARRGYSMLPYLAYLGGTDYLEPHVAERFWHDYGKTVGELFRDNFYARMHQRSEEHGLGWHTEGGNEWAYATRNPNSAWGITGIEFGKALPGYDLLGMAARGDLTMGEFWSTGGNRSSNKQAASAAHIYGKTIVQTEAFTGSWQARNHYQSHPALLKPSADQALIDGANRFVIHNYTMSPEEYGEPGIQFNWLINLNRGTTWWQQSHAFFDYLARGSYLLQQGLFVADVGLYRGDSVILAGNKATTQHDYDLLNTETLLTRASVDGHRVALADGMSYAVLDLELDSPAIPLAVLQKVHDLVEEGAVVRLGEIEPTRTPGLAGFPAGDDQVRALADTLWSAASPTGGTLGLGRVFRDVSVQEALLREGVQPDFSSDASPPWRYLHRRTDEGEIYLVVGSGSGDATFRVEDRSPELFDPVSGRILRPFTYRLEPDGRVTVPLNLGPDGSQFVVFRKPISEHRLVTVAEPARLPGLPPMEPTDSSDTTITARAWSWGSYRVQTAAEKAIELDVPPLPPQRTVAGPWQISFQADRGAPANSVTFDTLIPWNEHADSGIRHFSGTATYQTSIELSADEASGAVLLDLGQLANLVGVSVNGQSLGVLWKKPWRVDITDAVALGTNDLELQVTNLWPNRIIGDLLAGESFAQTNVRSYTSTDELLPSGLFGPVRLTFGEDLTVDFENLPAAVEVPTPHPGTNVAAASQGASALASSAHGSGNFPAEGAINGNRTTSDWGAGGGWNDDTPDVWNDWIEVRFAGSQIIDEIDVFTHGCDEDPMLSTLCGAYGIVEFEVRYYDGSTWLTVPGGAISGNTRAWRQLSFSPLATDRIRVVVGEGYRFSRVVELEAWAP